MDMLWRGTRLDEYLLKKDVLKTLSVDINVWPTVFDLGGCKPLSEQDASLEGFDGLAVSEEVWLNYPLYKTWEDVSTILRIKWRFEDKNVLVVALTCIQEANAPKEVRLSWPHTDAVPKVTWKPCQFLGYDIADSGMISGLMGCGYSVAEHNEAVQQWAKLLNEYHLFNDVDAAMAFRKWSDRRVVEHAPFAVFGLYASNVGQPGRVRGR